MSIKSYIQGKRITHRYELKENRDLNTGKFTRKPALIPIDEVEWETLTNAEGARFVVDGEIGQTSRRNAYNNLFSFDMSHRINLSETEEVCVIDKIYRADLHAYMVHTDKMISEEDAVDSADVKVKYGELVCEYNEQMIGSDAKLSTYCKVHGLTIANTDYDELKKIVYGDITPTISGVHVIGGSVTHCVNNLGSIETVGI